MPSSACSAHLVDVYLPLTENWLHRRLAGLRRYPPVVLAARSLDAAAYPLPAIHVFGDLPWPRRLLAALSCGPHRRSAWRGAGFFRQVLEAGPCRILHAHFAWMAKRHAGLRRTAREKLGCATATSFYGNDLRALRKPQGWVRRLFEEESAFIVEGPRMGERLAQAGCPPGKIHLNPLGIDLSLFPERRQLWLEAPLRALAVGRMVEKKGLDDAIRAVALANRRGVPVRLTIAGDGPLRSRLEDIIREEGAGGQVQLAGSVDHATLRRLYYEHQAILQPSVEAADGDTEGGAPVSIIEAMAAGLPVVATRHADIPGVVEDGKNACLAAERRPDELAEALCRLAGDPELAERFSSHGRARAEREFDCRTQAARLEEIYDRIAGAPN